MPSEQSQRISLTCNTYSVFEIIEYLDLFSGVIQGKRYQDYTPVEHSSEERMAVFADKNLSNTNHIDSEELSLLLSTLNNITNLAITYHQTLTTAQLNTIIAHNAQLEELDVNFCPLIVEADIVYGEEEEEETATSEVRPNKAGKVVGKSTLQFNTSLKDPISRGWAQSTPADAHIVNASM
eukprot:gene23427-29645_t